MRKSNNLYINFGCDPELLKGLERLDWVTNTDFWVKPVDNMGLHWAVIECVSEKEFKVVFFDSNSKVFDELVFASLIEAEQALSSYMFGRWNYGSEDSKVFTPKPDFPLFIDKKKPFPLSDEYSSGKQSRCDFLISEPPDMYSPTGIKNLNNQYCIKGYFYTHADKPYRKYVEIKRYGKDVRKPELMVVMMNPGDASPVSGEIEENQLTETSSDKTLNQIQRVMLCTGLKYVRVLNLSDKKAPNSKAFYAFLDLKNENDFPHSIFDHRRETELAELFINDVPVIYAWGVHPKLKELSEVAIKAIGQRNPIGVKKEGETGAYYHPLKYSTPELKEWVRSVAGMLVVQHGFFNAWSN